MSTNTNCPSCSKKYAGFDGEDSRKPVVFTCLCVFCKECALEEEAKAQQQHPASASGGGGKKRGKAKKKKKEVYTPTPCMSCSKPCTLPVSKLKLDVVAMKAVDVGSAQPTAVPICDNCEEEQATQFCGDCKINHQTMCDSCHAFAHKSAKKQCHTAVLIQAHLASGALTICGARIEATAAAVSKMCDIHKAYPLHIFCETCQMLICAMCSSFDHAGHIYKPIQEAIDAHRTMVEAAVAAVRITQQEAIAATNAIKIIRGELEGNRDAAIKLIDAGFNKLLHAITQRRDALKKMVNGAYNEKDDVLNKQITELEGIDSHSEIAMQLVEATVATATPVELLERAQLFVDGMAQLTAHVVPLKEMCASTISMQVASSFEQQAANILAVGWINTEDTDPAASTAAGEGLDVANVGNVAEFVVTAVDVGTGKQRRGGGDSLAVLLLQNGAANDSSGGGGAAEAKPGRGKRKRGGSSSSSSSSSSEEGRAYKKGKTVAAPSAAAPGKTEVVVTDNGDGTYSCSYTPPEGADAVGGGKVQLQVLLNGTHIVGSPFAIEVRPRANMTNWAFGSVAAGQYTLSEGGAVATKINASTHRGVIADGAGCAPMASGVNYWELEVVNVGASTGHWFFGVCRPGIDLDAGATFCTRADTWMMCQWNAPGWGLRCTTCAGTGMTLDPQPDLPAGSRVGLLLDLDNGGTLTMYLQGKPCGTIAEGLVGPLLPCISSYFRGKVVKIHGRLAPPPQ